MRKDNRSGEWWRTLTALGLHADPSQPAGNMVIGMFIDAIPAINILGTLLWPVALVARREAGT